MSTANYKQSYDSSKFHFKYSHSTSEWQFGVLVRYVRRKHSYVEKNLEFNIITLENLSVFRKLPDKKIINLRVYKEG